MTVRRKTLLIIAITYFGLEIVLYAASPFFLQGGFIKLEQASAREKVQRVLNAFDPDLASTDRFTDDRAAADETDNSLVSLTIEFIHEGSARTVPRSLLFLFLLGAYTNPLFVL